MRISNCWKNFHFLLSYPLSFPLASMSVLRNMCVPCFQLIANTTSHSSAAHKVIVWEYLFETWLEHPWISRSYHLCESQSSAPPIVSRVCQKSSLSPQWILMLVHSRVNVKTCRKSTGVCFTISPLFAFALYLISVASFQHVTEFRESFTITLLSKC